MHTVSDSKTVQAGYILLQSLQLEGLHSDPCWRHLGPFHPLGLAKRQPGRCFSQTCGPKVRDVRSSQPPFPLRALCPASETWHWTAHSQQRNRLEERRRNSGWSCGNV